MGLPELGHIIEGDEEGGGVDFTLCQIILIFIITNFFECYTVCCVAFRLSFACRRQIRGPLRTKSEPDFWRLSQRMLSTAVTSMAAPEWIVSDILSNFFGFCRTPLHVRQDTNRLNISYSVQVNANVQTLTAECKRIVAKLGRGEKCCLHYLY